MHMDRAVFDLKMSVHAVSLYILICSLLDEGREVTLEAIKTQWPASEDALLKAARELEAQGVIRIHPESSSPGWFTVRPSSEWVRHH